MEITNQILEKWFGEGYDYSTPSTEDDWFFIWTLFKSERLNPLDVVSLVYRENCYRQVMSTNLKDIVLAKVF